MILRACLLLFTATLSNAYFVIKEECLNYTVYPVQYELSITPYIFDKHAYYDCDLVITILANSPDVQVIELDAANDLLINENIQVTDSQNIDLVNLDRPYDYDREHGKLYIYLNSRLKKYSLDNTLYYVKISFRRNIKDSKEGIFLADYDLYGNVKNVLVTRLSPNKAKYFFPCFYNLQFESLFKFKVKLVQGAQGFNTALVVADEQNHYTENNKKTTIIEYAPSPQISLHQVGFHVSDYNSKRAVCQYTNDTLIIWAPRHKLHHYDFILNFGRNISDIIHEYAKINRPIVKGVINIVSVPKTLDGYEIESWNLLTNGENRLSYDTQYMSIKQKEKMLFELVQQLTRIWLGNPGEPERTRWKEQWFKEGVATYLAYYFFAEYYHWPLNVYMIQTKHKAMNIDWLHTTPFLTTFDNTLAVEIPSRYKDLVSWKTASLLWMVENWVGSEKFHRALIKYINSRRGKLITLNDFTTQLDLDTVECQDQFLNGKTSSNVLNSWFNQPGYPLVEVTTFRNRTPNVVYLKQSRFTFSSNSQSSYKYMIPISYRVQRHASCFNCVQPRFTVEADTYSFEENLDGGWIILNRNASGYYRVNYDIETWNLIAKALQENVESIDPLNRAQIVNDVFAIYAAGGMTYELAINVLRFLEKEQNQIVWQSAAEGFEMLKIEGAKCNMTRVMFDEWKSFMRNCIKQVYDSVIDSNNERSRLFKSIIRDFACSLEHQNCLFRLNTIYSGYLRGTNALHPDLREACYYNAFNTNAPQRQSNIFEEEDKTTAQFNWQTHRRFWHHIPQGYKRPLPLISTTPQPVTTTGVIVSAKVGPNSSNQVSLSITNTLLLFFICYFI